MDFTGKVVLITGASSGIGAASAIRFSKLGAKLSLTGRNEENLRTVAENCRLENSQNETFYVTGDASKEEDVNNIFQSTINRFGRLDVLVNNVGFVKNHDFNSLTLEIYDSIMDTNIRGVVLLTKLAMPYLIEAKGNVVNVSSVAGLRPGTMNPAYYLSKAAMDQFTKCVALEVASKQVRVNSINPGGVKTDFMNRMGFDPAEIPQVEEYFTKMHPLGRFASAEEIASTIAFLASDLASNITGVLLPSDGGLSINPPQ